MVRTAFAQLRQALNSYNRPVMPFYGRSNEIFEHVFMDEGYGRVAVRVLRYVGSPVGMTAVPTLHRHSLGTVPPDTPPAARLQANQALRRTRQGQC